MRMGWETDIDTDTKTKERCFEYEDREDMRSPDDAERIHNDLFPGWTVFRHLPTRDTDQGLYAIAESCGSWNWNRLERAVIHSALTDQVTGIIGLIYSKAYVSFMKSTMRMMTKRE